MPQKSDLLPLWKQWPPLLANRSAMSTAFSFHLHIFPILVLSRKWLVIHLINNWSEKPVSSPVGGNEGVFVIKVDNVSAKANYNVDVEQARRSMLQSQESIIQRAGTDALKKKAKIEDDRGKFL